MAGGGADLNSIQQVEQAYDEIAIQIRTHLSLENLRTLLSQHKSLHRQVLEFVGGGEPEQPTSRKTLAQETDKSSSSSEPAFAHFKNTIKQPSNKLDTSSPTKSPPDIGFQKSVTKPTSPTGLIQATGLPHITLKQTLLAASDRFREQLPLHARPMNWHDVIEAAYQLRPTLHISQQSWSAACQTLGRPGAAICLLLTDQATHRKENHVTQPAAYFKTMIPKSKKRRIAIT